MLNSLKMFSNACLFALILTTLGLGGCKSGMKQFDITVRLDESLQEQPPTLDVDLVGIGSGEASLREMPVDEYFKAERDGGPSHYRRDLEGTQQKVTMQFSHSDREEKTLSRSDPIWDNWKQSNLMEIMVIVELLPGTDSDTARRMFIPLDSGRWESRDNRLTITIQRSRLDLRPQPLPQ